MVGKINKQIHENYHFMITDLSYKFPQIYEFASWSCHDKLCLVQVVCLMGPEWIQKCKKRADGISNVISWELQQEWWSSMDV